MSAWQDRLSEEILAAMAAGEDVTFHSGPSYTAEDWRRLKRDLTGVLAVSWDRAEGEQ